MVVDKKWHIKSSIPQDSPDRLEAIRKVLLLNRQIIDTEILADFFTPGHPQTIKIKNTGINQQSVKAAIKRLKQALKKKETVVIYGDYDTDGITSTAILWETLNAIGIHVLPFLPHREDHGYGLKPKGIDTLIAQYGKPDLIITVDNGIVAFEGADYCQTKGIDLIICDHHEPAPSDQATYLFPVALAVIHTTKTAGAGVTYLFSLAVLQAFNNESDILNNTLLELATIGVIADMVPLVSISRQIVVHGLAALPNTQRPGLKALISQAQVDTSQGISTYHIGFLLAPRLNATGRMEHCLDSLRLLCTKDNKRAMKLSVDLEVLNKQRQELTQSTLISAINECNKNHNQKLLISASEKYNPGVIGLVAGKMVEQYYRPAIVISVMEEIAKGSVRSVPGFNIIDFLRRYQSDFIDLGGHPMAAGFSIATKSLDVVMEKLINAAQESIEDALLVPTLSAETELVFNDLSFDLINQINLFSPFGFGNPQPVFITRNVMVQLVKPVGKSSQHLKMVLCQPDLSSASFDAIFFSANSWINELKFGDMIDIAYQPDVNQWNGNRTLQLVIKDIKKLKPKIP